MKVKKLFSIYIKSEQRITVIMKIYLWSHFIRGYKLTLLGIYDALSKHNLKSNSKFYRLQYNMRTRFINKLNLTLDEDYLNKSFDTFYRFIHSLSEEELSALFGTHITFI